MRGLEKQWQTNGETWMNKFTKEELKEIKRCLKYMTKGGTTPYSLLTMRIHDKVKRMIETYDTPECQHEFITPVNENFRPIGSSECLICGEKG